MTISQDPGTGRGVIAIKQGNTAIKIEPKAGANVFSIRYKGTELIKTPKSLKELPGYTCGVPVLYPTPNRVRGGVFTFAGRQYKFKPNNDGNFLHGLVNNRAWQVENIALGNSGEMTFKLDFSPGTELYKEFPFRHTLSLAIAALDDGVRGLIRSIIRRGTSHSPSVSRSILISSIRDCASETFITIPATHLMESKKQLPSGKLLDLNGSSYDARKPKSLAGFFSDDVYFGMKPSAPTVIDFRRPRLKVTIKSSADFTHLVLYTPKDQPFFCVESQTCSTDAHNLYAKGLKKESHLQVVKPGEKASGHVEFHFHYY